MMMPVDADRWQHCMCSDTELIGGIEELIEGKSVGLSKTTRDNTDSAAEK